MCRNWASVGPRWSSLWGQGHDPRERCAEICPGDTCGPCHWDLRNSSVGPGPRGRRRCTGARGRVHGGTRAAGKGGRRSRERGGGAPRFSRRHHVIAATTRATTTTTAVDTGAPERTRNVRHARVFSVEEVSASAGLSGRRRSKALVVQGRREGQVVTLALRSWQGDSTLALLRRRRALTCGASARASK